MQFNSGESKLHSVFRDSIPAVLLAAILLVMVSGCFADVALELGTDRTQYLLEEQFYVNTTARNVGTAPTTIFGALIPESPFLTIMVKLPGGQPRAMRMGNADTNWLESGIELRPGESYGRTLDLTLEFGPDRIKSLLSQPGEYVISAVYWTGHAMPGGPVTVHSNQLRLTVAEPTGADQEAYRLLRDNPGRGADCDSIWDPGRQAVDTYEAVVKKFPDSPYALHARYYLGFSYSTHSLIGRKETTVEERLEAFGKAAQMFVQTAEKAGETPLGVRARMLAGANLGRTCDVTRSQHELEEAFFSPAATDGYMEEALAYLSHLEHGYWERHIYKDSNVPQPRAPLALQLRRYADALGFDVDWKPETKQATLSNSRAHAAFQAGASDFIVNGVKRPGGATSIKDGRVYVSASAMSALMAERRASQVQQP